MQDEGGNIDGKTTTYMNMSVTENTWKHISLYPTEELSPLFPQATSCMGASNWKAMPRKEKCPNSLDLERLNKITYYRLTGIHLDEAVNI